MRLHHRRLRRQRRMDLAESLANLRIVRKGCDTHRDLGEIATARTIKLILPCDPAFDVAASLRVAQNITAGLAPHQALQRHQRPVKIRPPVAEELPRAPYLRDLIQVQVRRQHLILVP